MPFAFVPPRHRWSWPYALAVLTAGVVGVATGYRAAPTPPVVTVPTLVPMIVPAPTPEPDAFIRPPVRGVATARHDGRLRVAWTERDVFVSTDGGAYFEQTLERAGAVSDAAFDSRGRLHVLRADGWLGIHDDGAEVDETWTFVGRFLDPDVAGGYSSQRPRLVIDRDTAAVIGVDPTEPTRLVVARSDRDGRWKTAPLFEDDSYDSWEGVEVWSIGAITNGRVRVVVRTWENDMCGHEGYHELLLDLRRGTARTRPLGYEAPAP
jgi:hypothetical protein